MPLLVECKSEALKTCWPPILHVMGDYIILNFSKVSKTAVIGGRFLFQEKDWISCNFTRLDAMFVIRIIFPCHK